jgi:cysteine-rich repeat protein
VCEPAFSFVAVLRFNITNVNPAGLVYDPERRSFAGHKSQDSQDPIELCLDGTVLNPNDGECSDGNGCIIAPDGSTSDLAPPCTDGAPDTCYESPIRPVTQGTLVGAAYDPFADRLVFLTSLGSRVTLTHVPSHFDELSDDVTNYQVELSGLTTPKGLTIGEDGNLYIVDDEGTPAVVVYPRRRDTSLELIVPDCATVPEDNCTGFEASPDLAAEWDVPSVDPLDAIFTVPGENWVGIFNQPTGATEYEGTDAEGNTINSSEYFTFYDPALTAIPPLVGRSSLPGELFQLGDIGTSYSQEAQAAETAADGGSFVVCTATASEYCQLFARGCSEDADCEVVPGTVCATGATIPYCHAPGDARDDRFFVEVDATGNNLDVLANDSLSESACLDPVMRILSVDTTGMSGSLVDFAEGDTFLTYDAPGGGECGLVDSFEYTADLGGGVTDTASVRVVIECVCGDGEAQSNEQCDEGDDNGEYPARCSDECMFNVHCGDTHIDPGEECDDGNALSGDGCSALCTLESVCGDGIVEGVEACDDGNNDSGDGCNGNCTEPECGDGSLDYDNDEQCDDGNVANGDGCSQLCTIETECGNGAIEGTEECDDGNILPGDGCSAACTVEGQCGNGVIDEDTGEECDTAFTGSQCADQAECSNRCLCGNYCGDGRIGDLEECDDGQNGVTGDGCRDDCTDEVCGDGIQDPDEECDDGNLDPADGCTNSCEAFTVCGNGALEEGEECDDGNNRSGDGCSSTCANEVTVCGDGAVDFDEQCDDGNTDPGDGCDENCLSEGAVCGDGTREEGEECDDGNRVSGDGCDEQCRWELF